MGDLTDENGKHWCTGDDSCPICYAEKSNDDPVHNSQSVSHPISSKLPDPQLTENSMTAMVDRFLAWPLPDSVCADLCATKQVAPHRSGTTLLTAVEAKQMLEHVVGPVLASRDAEIEHLKESLAYYQKHNAAFNATWPNKQKEIEELRRESERLKAVRNAFKVCGTDRCATCPDGRVTLFIANRKCIECDPDGYTRDAPIHQYKSEIEELRRDLEFMHKKFEEQCERAAKLQSHLAEKDAEIERLKKWQESARTEIDLKQKEIEETGKLWSVQKDKLDDARSGIKLAAVRLEILTARMRGCNAETGKHELLDEAEMFCTEARECLDRIGRES